ncbi:HEPN domain-containing protein [Geoalkalibacter halelectricus]|uniref:HEPN domain-containing protein n=1 Tax=Geoalkalibacter halelectricus TaxID=2847045 RepID=UPI00345F8D8E
MEKRTEEWLRQSDYDFETAEVMFNSGRQIYAVFMCHLAIGIFLPRWSGKSWIEDKRLSHG